MHVCEDYTAIRARLQEMEREREIIAKSRQPFDPAVDMDYQEQPPAIGPDNGDDVLVKAFLDGLLMDDDI